MCILANMNEQVCSWIINFHKVVQQQIWGEVVDFAPAFIWECGSERIIKIGQSFVKVIAKIKRLSFLWLSV